MHIKISFIAIITLTIFLAVGCYEEPRKFIAPKLDYEFSLPLFSKNYILKDLLQDSLINDIYYYDEGDFKGVLYYKKSENFPAIKVEKEAKIRLRESYFNLFLTDFDFSIPALPISIPISDFVSMPPGSYPNIPPISSTQVSKNVDLFDNINYIIFDDNSSLVIEFENNTQLPVTIESFSLTNYDESFPIISLASQINLSPGQKITRNFNVSQKLLKKNAIVSLSINSPGSSSPVVISASDNLKLIPNFNNVKIFEINGNFSGAKKLIDTLNHVVSDSTFFRLVTIDEAFFYIKIENKTNIGFTGTLEAQNLFTPSNQKYSSNLSVTPKSSNLIEFDLMSHKLQSSQLTNIVPLIANLNFNFPNNYITISKNDSLLITIGSNVIIFNLFDGKLKPTILENNIGTTINFSFSKYFYKLGFDSIDIYQPKFTALVTASSDGEVRFGGTLYAIRQQSIISSLRIPTVTTSKSLTAVIQPDPEDSRTFIRNFNSDPPDSFIVSAQVILNPNYKDAKYSRFDSIYGTISVELPAIIAIKNGYFTDTAKIWTTISDNNQKRINDFKYAELVVEFENYFGVQLIAKGYFTDSLYNKLFNLPADANRDSILIPAAQIDNLGNRINTTISKTSIAVGETQISKIQKIKNFIFKLRVDTYYNGYKIAKFREDDKIKVRSYVRFKYFVDPDNF